MYLCHLFCVKNSRVEDEENIIDRYRTEDIQPEPRFNILTVRVTGFQNVLSLTWIAISEGSIITFSLSSLSLKPELLCYYFSNSFKSIFHQKIYGKLSKNNF